MPYGNKILDISDSENGLLPDNIKPLPKPLLTQDYWHPSWHNFAENAQHMLVKINDFYWFLHLSQGLMGYLIFR